MSTRSIVLVGWPDSGKTNFLGAFWESVRTGGRSLVVPTPPNEIKYVEEAVEFQSRGEFAPRSDKNLEESRKDFTLPVKLSAAPAAEVADIVVPDVTGELWKAAVETGELPPEWMDELRAASGALLFIRVRSPLNVDPLDWVTTERLLRLKNLENADEATARSIPTQVALCELLRFLELSIPTAPGGEKPRVAVMVTAWDLLDAETAERGPEAFLEAEYPLFAGRLNDVERLEARVFGVSAVGGDFIDPVFKAKYLEDETVSGYVVTRQGGDQIADVGLPIAWVLGGRHRGSPMTGIVIEQQVHGYRSGHQLLSASVKLSRDDQDLVDRLSDIAGSLRPGETFGPYLTTYPLPSQAYYVVARTWQDTGAPRAGCVRTRSLLVPLGAWESLPYVGSIVSLLTPIDDGAANVPLQAPAVESVFAPVHDDRIFELVEALFLESRQPIVMFDAPEAETMTLRLLTALWPGRRRSFAACTLSLGPRKLMGRDFDIVFSLRDARSRFSDWTGRRIEPSTRATSPRHHWSAELAEAIFLSDAPMLGAWDDLGILKADQIGDETSLRLSLLWRELEGKARTTPNAVLGMLDILNSHSVGTAAFKAKLAPLVIQSVNLAATRERPAVAWRFLVMLLGKFPDRLPTTSVLREIRRASADLAARHLAASITFLDEMDAEDREMSAVIAAGLGDGIATADPNDEAARRLATVEPMSTLRLLAYSRRFARWLCGAIGQNPSAWIDCLLKALERPDADLLRRARRHVAPYLNSAALAPAVEPLMRGVTAVELGAAVAAVGKSTSFTVEAFDGPFIAAARDQESIYALRRAILDVGESPSSSRFLLRTLRLDLSDITWLCNASGMERRRVTNLLLGLLSRSDDFTVQAVQRDAAVADLMLQTLLEDQVRAAEQVARILLLGQFRADRLIEVGLRVYPHVLEDNRRRLALALLSRGLVELEAHPAVSLDQLIRQATPYIDGRQLIVLATQASALPLRIAENLAALDRSDAPVRTMIASRADELTDRLVSRPFEDRREMAYIHWASLIKAAGPVAYDTHLRSAISALSFALRRPQLPLSALVVVSFPTVYRQLLMSKGESDFSSLPSLLLLPLTFFADWDRAKVARRELVEAFVRSEWPPANLMVAALDAGIEQRVLRRVSRQRQGERYIERIWCDSSRLNAPLQGRIRDAITDFRRGGHRQDWD